MKKSRKTSLIIIALVLIACVAGLVWLGSRPNEMGETNELVGASVSETSRGPSFEVRVVVPRMARPLGGILPDWLVRKLDGTPSELRFDHASRGAQIGSVGHDRVKLSADGWDLSIQTDSEGRITSGTRLVFLLALGGRQVRLRCSPANHAGYLSTTTRAGTDQLDGGFLVELATCENAESGKTMDWPPSPLTLRGSFAGLPQGRR